MPPGRRRKDAPALSAEATVDDAIPPSNINLEDIEKNLPAEEPHEPEKAPELPPRPPSDMFPEPDDDEDEDDDDDEPEEWP